MNGKSVLSMLLCVLASAFLWNCSQPEAEETTVRPDEPVSAGTTMTDFGKLHLKGYVFSASSLERLAGVKVEHTSSFTATVTGADGYYELQVPKQASQSAEAVRYSFPGYYNAEYTLFYGPAYGDKPYNHTVYLYEESGSQGGGSFPTPGDGTGSSSGWMTPEEMSYSVSGVIVDESGEPVMGTTIVVQGTTDGATADVSGRFVLKFRSKLRPSALRLVISYMGYSTKYLGVTDYVTENLVVRMEEE